MSGTINFEDLAEELYRLRDKLGLAGVHEMWMKEWLTDEDSGASGGRLLGYR